jgi:hypothetical protein
MARHKQQLVAGIRIDHKLALVIACLWDNGVRTRSSCQGMRDGFGYIEFAAPADAGRFDSLVRIDLQATTGDAQLDEQMRTYSELTGATYAQPWFGDWHVHHSKVVLMARFTPNQRELMKRWLMRDVRKRKPF